MKYVLGALCLLIWPLAAQAQGYSYEERGAFSIAGPHLTFVIKSPACWAQSASGSGCKDTLSIYISDTTDPKTRNAYQLKVKPNGQAILALESKPGVFNWSVFEGQVTGGCRTECTFGIPAKKIRLKDFKLWYSGDATSQITVDGHALAVVHSPTYPYLQIKNSTFALMAANPFAGEPARVQLLQGCAKQISTAAICDCYVQKIQTEPNIQKLFTSMSTEYNPLMIEDLYLTLLESWWSKYMGKQMNKKDMKQSAIMVLSMNAGMSCAQQNSKPPPQ